MQLQQLPQSLLLALLLTCSGAVSADDAANLLKNPSFDEGTSRWAPNPALTAHGSFSAHPDGKRNGRVGAIANRSGTETVAAYQTIPVTPGKVYEISGYCRSTKLQEGAGIAVHALNDAGTILQRRWVLQIPAWGALHWKEFREEYHPPKGAKTLQIRLSIYKQGKAWFDDLTLAAKDPPPKENPWAVKLEDFGATVTRIPTKRPVYRLAVHDIDGDGAQDLVIGDVDGILRCQKQSGTVLWERDLGGLPMDIACGDLDGDGRPEIVVCTADVKGTIQVFGADGSLRRRHSAPGRIYGHAAVADLRGDGRGAVLATYGNTLVALSNEGKALWTQSFGGPRMRDVTAGDLNGDGRPDVVVSLKAQSLFAAAVSAVGEREWVYKPIGGPKTPGEDICAADLDGDGRAEVVMASEQGTVVCIQDGRTKWLSTRPRRKLWSKHRDATTHLGSSRTEIAVGDFAPEREGLEVLAALVDSVWLLDKNGKFIWESSSGLLLLDLVAAPDGAVYAPSSGFRDRSVYRLVFGHGKDNLATYETPNPIYDDLDRTYRRLVYAKARSVESHEKFHVIFAGLMWPFHKYGSLDRLRAVHEFLKTKESANLEFVFMLWPKDLPVELHRGQMSEPREILRVVTFLEELGRPFLFFVDHGCAPNLSLDTMEKTLQLAPKTCRGFYVAENTNKYPTRRWDEFVDWAVKVMDLCKKHGNRKMIFKEMYDCWGAVPSDPRVREALLQPKYRDIVVVIYATNNPHAPELQTGGMIGLKQSGLVSGWGISTQHWNWSWAEHGLSHRYMNICPADVILRMELSAACLGARWFHIEGGQIYMTRGEAQLDPRAKRHRDLVYELMRKGILPPVPDADNLSFSNLVIARRHHPLIDEARKENRAVGPPKGRPVGPLGSGFLGVHSTLQSVPDDYFPPYAYGVRRFCDTMFPATPFGYVRIVPDCADVQPFLAGKDVLLTDGCGVFINGKRTNASSARTQVLTRLERGVQHLPFRADGVFLATHRLGDRYRVWLIDPGYMCPCGVETRVIARVPG